MNSTIHIGWNDEDSQGHVSHLSMIRWIAESRIRFIDGLLEESGLFGKVDYVLVHLSCDFLEPINWPGVVETTAIVEAVGRKSLTTYYEIFYKGEVAVTARAVNVFFDIQSKAIIKIPQTLRKVGEAWKTNSDQTSGT